MANLPDTQIESSLTTEDDDALDPRVQVWDFIVLVFNPLFNLDRIRTIKSCK